MSFESAVTLVLLVSFSAAMLLDDGRQRWPRVVAGGAAIVLAVLLLVPGVQ